MFEPLKDKEFFSRIRVETVVWENGAPEFLYYQSFKNDKNLFKEWGYNEQ